MSPFYYDLIFRLKYQLVVFIFLIITMILTFDYSIWLFNRVESH